MNAGDLNPWRFDLQDDGESNCSHCGRNRIALCVNGKHRCEKCDFSPEENRVISNLDPRAGGERFFDPHANPLPAFIGGPSNVGSMADEFLKIMQPYLDDQRTVSRRHALLRAAAIIAANPSNGSTDSCIALAESLLNRIEEREKAPAKPIAKPASGT